MHSLEPGSLLPHAKLIIQVPIHVCVEDKPRAWKILVMCWTLMTFHGHDFY